MSVTWRRHDDILDDSEKNGHCGMSGRIIILSEDPADLQRLACHLLKPPQSFERLEFGGGLVRYRNQRAAKPDGEPFAFLGSGLDFGFWIDFTDETGKLGLFIW